MKKLFTLILASFSIGLLSAQTNVSGNVSGTWTKANSPYVLTGAVTVLSGSTLTIEPGVTVSFLATGGGGLYMDVKGTLIAKGKADSMITFQGNGAGLDGFNNQNNKSGPVYIESNSSNSILQYVVVDALGYGYNQVKDTTAAINVSSSSCSIINCIIKNIRGTGVIFHNPGSKDVSDNTFDSNRIGLKFENTSPNIIGNSISHSTYLDLITETDNLHKLINNNPLHIGLTSNLVISLTDTLNSYNSDYTLVNALTVPTGKTLVILPGAKVIFPAIGGGGLYMDVQGKLIAKGTASTYITFQGNGTGLDGFNNQNNKSGPVFIESSSINSILQYVVVDALGYGYNQVKDNTAAIDIRSSACSITNCYIQNIRGTGVLFENYNSTPVSGNTFSNNRVGLKFDNFSGIVSNDTISNSGYLDLITEVDNIGKLVNNTPFHIGLTANVIMSQNDTLTSYNYDYTLLNALTVPANKILTVQPGAKIIFPAIGGGGLYLDIQGRLIAKGTPDNYITFQGNGTALDGFNNQNSQCGPVNIESSSINSILQYVIVDALGHGYNQLKDSTAAINISSGSCKVFNCTIQNTRGTGIAIHNASPDIEGTCFTSNTGAIFSNGGNAKIFHSNFVSDASFGVKNISTTDTLDASNCWWNSPIGPNSTDSVSAGVLFNSWAFAPFDCSDSGILPVAFLSFNAINSGKFITCTWKTASELNAGFFTVQRSTNGINFADINTVSATGNTNAIHTYNYYDNAFSSLNAVKLYYRLKETDKDGKSQLSKVAVVEINGKQPLIVIYPVPAKNTIHIDLQQTLSDNAVILLYDMNGRKVKQQKPDINSLHQQLQVGELLQGNYNLLIIDNGKDVYKNHVTILH